MNAFLFDACDIIYHRPGYEQKLESYFGPEWRVLNKQNRKKIKALQARAARGKISLDEMYDGISSLYGRPARYRARDRRFLARAMAEITFFDGVRDTLHHLHDDGFKLAIVTNSFQPGKTKLEWFSKAGIDKIWDAFITSSETGAFKPEPEIFFTTLGQLGCKAQDAAFIAHSADELNGAKAIGMTTIAFNRDDETVRADYIIGHFSELLDLARSLRRKASGGTVI